MKIFTFEQHHHVCSFHASIRYWWFLNRKITKQIQLNIWYNRNMFLDASVNMLVLRHGFFAVRTWTMGVNPCFTSDSIPDLDLSCPGWSWTYTSALKASTSFGGWSSPFSFNIDITNPTSGMLSAGKPLILIPTWSPQIKIKVNFSFFFDGAKWSPGRAQVWDLRCISQ